jgi:GNAT superfamily N-acetyltransferase
VNIRPMQHGDRDAVWSILEPVLRAGDTYALPADWSRDQALAYWCAPSHAVFVADDTGEISGTYTLKANQQGGGGHVANCGFVTRGSATGRGVARAMCEHALETAKARGFSAMQFNFVVSTNTRAVALWQSCGFAIAGTLPGAFRHPAHGFVDAYVMHRQL